jgi:ankyrin repeat protein
VVSVLLGAGAKVDPKHRAGQTPLARAIAADRFRIAKKLIRAGADVRSPRIQGEPLIFEAIRARRADVVELMLAHGADPHSRLSARNVSTLVSAAVFQGSGSLDSLEAIRRLERPLGRRPRARRGRRGS